MFHSLYYLLWKSAIKALTETSLKNPDDKKMREAAGAKGRKNSRYLIFKNKFES